MTVTLRSLVAALTLGLASVASAQDVLDPVRQLYASAEYEEALAVLDRSAIATPDGGRYRVLCLIALGRVSEADRVIEEIVMSTPAFDPGAEAPPRIRNAFVAVQRRVLPPLARSLYLDGKTAFDRESYVEAAQLFERAMPVIEQLAGQGRPGMEELRMLASGFLSLSRARIVPVVPPPPLLAARPSVEVQVEALPPAAAPPAAMPLTEPVAVRQDLPPWTHGVANPEAVFQGAIDVQIDESGSVIDAIVVESIHPLYNPLLLRAAREWRYVPATRGGQPVQSYKRVEVVLRPR